LYYINGNVNRSFSYKQNGFSVRCLRDWQFDSLTIFFAGIFSIFLG
jgi:hypothetical protein